VFVALVNQHALRMRRIVIRLYRSFPRYGNNSTIFEKKKNYWSKNTCFDFLHNFETFLTL